MFEINPRLSSIYNTQVQYSLLNAIPYLDDDEIQAVESVFQLHGLVMHSYVNYPDILTHMINIWHSSTSKHIPITLKNNVLDKETIKNASDINAEVASGFRKSNSNLPKELFFAQADRGFFVISAFLYRFFPIVGDLVKLGSTLQYIPHLIPRGYFSEFVYYCIKLPQDIIASSSFQLKDATQLTLNYLTRHIYKTVFCAIILGRRSQALEITRHIKVRHDENRRLKISVDPSVAHLFNPDGSFDVHEFWWSTSITQSADPNSSAGIKKIDGKYVFDDNIDKITDHCSALIIEIFKTTLSVPDIRISSIGGRMLEFMETTRAEGYTNSVPDLTEEEILEYSTKKLKSTGNHNFEYYEYYYLSHRSLGPKSLPKGILYLLSKWRKKYDKNYPYTKDVLARDMQFSHGIVGRGTEFWEMIQSYNDDVGFIDDYDIDGDISESERPRKNKQKLEGKTSSTKKSSSKSHNKNSKESTQSLLSLSSGSDGLVETQEIEKPKNPQLVSEQKIMSEISSSSASTQEIISVTNNNSKKNNEKKEPSSFSSSDGAILSTQEIEKGPASSAAITVTATATPVALIDQNLSGNEKPHLAEGDIVFSSTETSSSKESSETLSKSKLMRNGRTSNHPESNTVVAEVTTSTLSSSSNSYFEGDISDKLRSEKSNGTVIAKSSGENEDEDMLEISSSSDPSFGQTGESLNGLVLKHQEEIPVAIRTRSRATTSGSTSINESNKNDNERNQATDVAVGNSNGSMNSDNYNNDVDIAKVERMNREQKRKKKSASSSTTPTTTTVTGPNRLTLKVKIGSGLENDTKNGKSPVNGNINTNSKNSKNNNSELNSSSSSSLGKRRRDPNESDYELSQSNKEISEVNTSNIKETQLVPKPSKATTASSSTPLRYSRRISTRSQAARQKSLEPEFKEEDQIENITSITVAEPNKEDENPSSLEISSAEQHPSEVEASGSSDEGKVGEEISRESSIISMDSITEIPNTSYTTQDIVIRPMEEDNLTSSFESDTGDSGISSPGSEFEDGFDDNNNNNNQSAMGSYLGSATAAVVAAAAANGKAVLFVDQQQSNILSGLDSTVLNNNNSTPNPIFFNGMQESPVIVNAREEAMRLEKKRQKRERRERRRVKKEEKKLKELKKVIKKQQKKQLESILLNANSGRRHSNSNNSPNFISAALSSPLVQKVIGDSHRSKRRKTYHGGDQMLLPEHGVASGNNSNNTSRRASGEGITVSTQKTELRDAQKMLNYLDTFISRYSDTKIGAPAATTTTTSGIKPELQDMNNLPPSVQFQIETKLIEALRVAHSQRLQNLSSREEVGSTNLTPAGLIMGTTATIGSNEQNITPTTTRTKHQTRPGSRSRSRSRRNRNNPDMFYDAVSDPSEVQTNNSNSHSSTKSHNKKKHKTPNGSDSIPATTTEIGVLETTTTPITTNDISTPQEHHHQQLESKSKKNRTRNNNNNNNTSKTLTTPIEVVSEAVEPTTTTAAVTNINTENIPSASSSSSSLKKNKSRRKNPTKK